MLCLDPGHNPRSLTAFNHRLGFDKWPPICVEIGSNIVWTGSLILHRCRRSSPFLAYQGQTVIVNPALLLAL